MFQLLQMWIYLLSFIVITKTYIIITVMRHAHVEALLEAAVLTFIAGLLVNATVEITVVIYQL